MIMNPRFKGPFREGVDSAGATVVGDYLDRVECEVRFGCLVVLRPFCMITMIYFSTEEEGRDFEDSIRLGM